MTMDFIRWGAMSPLKHKEAKLPYNSKEGGHTAPIVWGIYAFPKGFVYRWLWGMLESDLHQNSGFRWVRDANGNKVRINEIGDEKNESVINKKLLLLRRLNKIPKNGVLNAVSGDDGNINNGFLYGDGLANIFKYGGEIWHHLEFSYYMGQDKYSWLSQCIEKVQWLSATFPDFSLRPNPKHNM